jgi:DnaJ-domain-containing protein 1
MKDYYYILGVENTANQETVKQAYRKLSIKFHPDKNDGDKFFEERFKEIQEAYENLSDDKKRRDYDFKFKTKTHYTRNTTTSNPIDDWWKKEQIQEEEKKNQEDLKRSKIYYTSKELLLNGMYLNCSGYSYKLSDFDSSTIRKDDTSNNGFWASILIFLVALTAAFAGVGYIFLLWGIYLLIFKDYFLVLITSNGDVPLLKGGKSKMKKISSIINKAVLEHKATF